MLHGSIKRGIPKFVKEIVVHAKGVQRLERKQSAQCVKSRVNALIQNHGETENPWVSGASRFEIG